MTMHFKKPFLFALCLFSSAAAATKSPGGPATDSQNEKKVSDTAAGGVASFVVLENNLTDGSWQAGLDLLAKSDDYYWQYLSQVVIGIKNYYRQSTTIQHLNRTLAAELGRHVKMAAKEPVEFTLYNRRIDTLLNFIKLKDLQGDCFGGENTKLLLVYGLATSNFDLIHDIFKTLWYKFKPCCWYYYTHSLDKNAVAREIEMALRPLVEQHQATKAQDRGQGVLMKTIIPNLILITEQYEMSDSIINLNYQECPRFWDTDFEEAVKAFRQSKKKA